MIPIQELSNYKFTHIVHISDLHIRPRERHIEYANIFKKLIQEIQKIKQKILIIITGDIFDNKFIFSPEAYSLCANLFTELSDLYPLLVIGGNHDQSDLNRLDSISPIAYPRKNFNYIKKSGAYEYGNIIFSITSLYDNSIEFIKRNQINTTKKCIALYHGTIGGSVNDEGFIFEDTNTSRFRKISNFEGYDATLLGDIHKMQKLSNNMWYSGSLIQQNFGESLENHGFLLWTIEPDIQVEFHEIKNEYGLVTIKIENDKWINPDIKFNNKNEIRCIITNTTETIKQNILDSIKNSNNIDFLNIRTIKNDKILNIFPEVPDDNQDGILIEINQKYQDDIHKNDLIEYHNKLIKQIKIQDKIINNVVWYPISLEFQNIFCYGNNLINKIDFKKGITSISGKNADGKSSIINIICYILFGETKINSGKSKNIDILNNAQKKGYIKCSFIHGNISYTIVKDLTRKVGKNPLEIKSNLTYCLNNKIETISQKDISDKMRELVGTLDDFIKTNMLDFKNIYDNFFRMTDIKKILYLKEILKLTYFDDLMVLNKNTSKAQSKDLSDLQYKQKILSENYPELKNTILIQSTTADLDTLNQDISKNNKILEDFHKKSADFYKNKIIMEKEITNLETENIKLLTDQLNKIKSKYPNFTTCFDLNDLKNNIYQNQLLINNTIKQSKSELTTIFDQLTREINLLQVADSELTKEELYGQIKQLTAEKTQYETDLNILLQKKLDIPDIEIPKTKLEYQTELAILQKKYKETGNKTAKQLKIENKNIEYKLKKNPQEINPTQSNDQLLKEITILETNLKNITNLIKDKSRELKKYKKLDNTCEITKFESEISKLEKQIQIKHKIPKKQDIDMTIYHQLTAQYNQLSQNFIPDQELQKLINNLENFETKNKILKGELATIKTQTITPTKNILIKLQTDNLNQNKSKIEDLLNQINKMNIIINNNKSIDNLILLNTEIESKNIVINSKISNLEYHKINNIIIKNTQDKENIKEQLDKLTQLQIKINLDTKLKENILILEKIDYNLNLDNQINQIQKFIDILNNKEITELIITKKQLLDLLLVKLDKFQLQYKKRELTDKINLTKSHIEIAENNSNISKIINDLKNNLEYEIARQDYNNIIIKINTIKNNNKLKLEIDKLDEILLHLKDQIKFHNDIQLNLQIKLDNLTKILNKMPTIISESQKITQDILNLEKNIFVTEKYDKIINPKGLPLKIIKSKLNSFSASMNVLLKKFTNYEIEFRYGIATAEDDLEIIVKNTVNNKLVTDRLSCFETLILLITFKQVLAQNTNTIRGKLFCIDELFECVDSHNFVYALADLVYFILQEFSYVLVISQRDIKHVAEYEIQINKINGISQIVN